MKIDSNGVSWRSLSSIMEKSFAVFDDRECLILEMMELPGKRDQFIESDVSQKGKLAPKISMSTKKLAYRSVSPYNFCRKGKLKKITSF